MRFASVRNCLAFTALVITFATSAWTQSFPPTMGSPYENVRQFDQSPSLATDPSGVYPDFYMGYGSDNSNDYLYISTSSDGTNWTDKAFTTLLRGYSPSIAFYNGYMWVAWVSDGGGGLTQGALYLDYTNNPSSGFSSSPVLVTQTGSAFYPANSPTLAVYNNQLWIAAIDSYQNIDTFATTNGTSFVVSGGCDAANDPAGYLPQSGAAVGMVAWNNLMYYAYQTDEPTGNHIMRVCSTDDSFPANYSYSSEGGYSSGSGVSATVFGSYLTFAFKNLDSNNVIVEGTSDGSSYTGEEYTFSMNGGDEINPAAQEFGGTFYVIFTGNASNHRMWTSHN